MEDILLSLHYGIQDTLKKITSLEETNSPLDIDKYENDLSHQKKKLTLLQATRLELENFPN